MKPPTELTQLTQPPAARGSVSSVSSVSGPQALADASSPPTNAEAPVRQISAQRQRQRPSRNGREERPAAPREFLTLAEFLDAMDVPKSTFFRWKAIGEAPRTYKLPNGQLRIRRTDFDAWIASREEPQAA